MGSLHYCRLLIISFVSGNCCILSLTDDLQFTVTMQIHVLKNPAELGASAGKKAAGIIKNAIFQKGAANIILATGASQFATLDFLINDRTIEWDKVSMFHLDEYIGIGDSHPASFRRYLRERFLDKINPLRSVNLINGDQGPEEECRRLNELIVLQRIDLALIGIGENGHLAFNDPPADFETELPYIIVGLDETCRKQQLNEGWFNTMDEVPQKAISMSVRQILKSENIVCSVPDKRKAEAVKNCIGNKINNLFPATVLQAHACCDIYLDEHSASQTEAFKILPYQ
jgi:glucosamine-6-phosphate deaminase